MGKLVADTAEITDLEQQLDALDRNGYLLVRGALNLEMVEAWRECLTRKYKHENGISVTKLVMLPSTICWSRSRT